MNTNHCAENRRGCALTLIALGMAAFLLALLSDSATDTLVIQLISRILKICLSPTGHSTWGHNGRAKTPWDIALQRERTPGGLMSNDFDDNDQGPDHKRPGRRPDGLGKHDLSDHLRHAQELFPDRSAGQGLKQLCDAMKNFRASRPRETTVSAQVNGSQPLSRRTLNALHAAFGLADLGLETRIWLETPNAFRDAVKEAAFGDPVQALRRLADGGDRVAIVPTGTVLGIGTPLRAERPRVLIGDRVQLRVTLPFSGRVTVANVDRDGGARLWNGLDRLFGTGNRDFTAGPLELPLDGGGVPVSEPAGLSTLVVVMVAKGEVLEPLPEADSDDGLALALVRRFAREVAALPPVARRVAVIDYDVLRS